MNPLKRVSAATLLVLPALIGAPRQLHSAPQSSAGPQAAGSIRAELSALLAQGFDLLSRQDASGAEVAFRKAIEIQPELASAHHGLALALWSQKASAEALREMTAATRLAPDDAATHFELGKFAWELSLQSKLPGAGDSKQLAADFLALAIHEMNQAASLNPQDATIQASLARVYLESQQSGDALTHAKEALRLAPSNPDGHVLLGQVLLTNSEESEAEAEFKKAIELDPNDGEVHLDMGQLRVRQRRYGDAQKEFGRAIELSPGAAPAYAAWAELLVNTGRQSQARGLLEKAVELDPGDWLSQYRLATLLIGAGDTPRATALLQEVSNRHPDFLPAREQLGMGLLRRGDVEGAAAEAEGLEGKNPQAAEGHHLMALVLWKRRDYEGSMAESAQALVNDADPSALLALEALELWQLDRKKEARTTFVRAAKVEPHLGNPEVFCRLVLCDARDIGPVEDFLKKNRWAIAPQDSP